MLFDTHRLREIRSRIQRSKVWEQATRTIFRLVLSILSVFCTMMFLMIWSAFLLVDEKVWGVFVIILVAVLLLLLRMLADEARRREDDE